jgi:hypothetical protein
MNIGLIDVDGHNFPNIALMKISAWHKQQGDSVEWYDPMLSPEMDIVYMSKVFQFTQDYQYHIRAKKVVKGGTGYCLSVDKKGKEHYDASQDSILPYDIEHIYPDYSLYPDLTEDTAYGYLTRGCPRGCDFCIVGKKEGRMAYKNADLSEFWRGQKNIVLLDPNITACKDWKQLFQQLIDSKATIDFSQGLDIRLMTQEKAEMLKQMKIKQVHFAWDKYQDKEIIVPKFIQFKDITGWDKRKMTVFVLCNFDTTFEQDLDRIMTLREIGYSPYVMLYQKELIPKQSNLRKLQRWVNNRIIFNSTNSFDEYLKGE